MKKHDSMRGWFAWELYQNMQKNKNIWVILGDLGYGMFDKIRQDFPQRCINTGAAEVTMMNTGVGLALEGKIPFVYSITTFLLYRPFEQIRNYVNHERIPVKLVGSGRDRDYAHDGFSHWSEDAEYLFNYYGEGSKKIFGNIKASWPETKEEIPKLVEKMINDPSPYFISLKR